MTTSHPEFVTSGDLTIRRIPREPVPRSRLERVESLGCDAIVARGPGRFSVAFVWKPRGYEVYAFDHDTTGAAPRKLDLPLGGELAYGYQFYPDGTALFLGSTFLLRKVDLTGKAPAPVQILLARNGLFGAHLLRDGAIVALYDSASALIGPDNPESMIFSELTGTEEGEEDGVDGLFRIRPDGTEEELELPTVSTLWFHVLADEKLWVLRSAPRLRGRKDWGTLVLHDDGSRSPRIIGSFADDIGEPCLSEDGKAILGDGGFRIDFASRPEQSPSVDWQAPAPVVRGAGCARGAVHWPFAKLEQVLPRDDVDLPFATPPSATARGLRHRFPVFDAPREMDESLVGSVNQAVWLYGRLTWPPAAGDTEIEAVAFALAHKRDVMEDLVDWWASSRGVVFALSTLLRVWDYRSGRYHTLTRPGPPRDDRLANDEDHAQPFLSKPEEPRSGAQLRPRSPWAFLRRHMASASGEAKAAVESLIAQARETASLPVRVFLDLVVPHRRDWVESDARACLALGKDARRYAAHLLGAIRDAGLARELADAYVGPSGCDSLGYTYGYELVSALGEEAVPVLDILLQRNVELSWQGPPDLGPLMMIRTASAASALVPLLVTDHAEPVDLHLRSLGEVALEGLGPHLNGRKKLHQTARALFEEIAPGFPERAEAVRAEFDPKKAKGRAKKPVPATSTPEATDGKTAAPKGAPPGPDTSPIWHPVFDRMQERTRPLAWSNDGWSKVRPLRGDSRRPVIPPPRIDRVAAFESVTAALEKTHAYWQRGMIGEVPSRWLRLVTEHWAKGADPHRDADIETLSVAFAMLAVRKSLRFKGSGGTEHKGVETELLECAYAQGGAALVLDMLCHSWTLRRTPDDDYDSDSHDRLTIEPWPADSALWDDEELPPEGKPRSFDAEPGPWRWLRDAIAALDGPDYAALRSQGEARRAGAPGNLRAALAYAFPDETAWADEDCDRLLSEEVRPRYSLGLVSLIDGAEKCERLLSGYSGWNSRTIGRYRSDPRDTNLARESWGEVFQIVYRQGVAALPVLKRILQATLEDRDDLAWTDDRQEVCEAIAVIQTPEAFAVLAPLCEIGRPELWELVAKYALSAPGAVLGYLTGERAVAEPVRAALALGVSRNQEGYASAFEDLLRTNPALKKNKTLGAARELADIFKAPIEDPERLPTPFRGAPAGKEKDGPRTFLSSERLPRPLLAETGKALPDAAVARLLSRLKLIQDQEPDAELKSLRQALDKPSRLEFGRALVSAWQNAGTNRRYAWVHDAAVFLGAPAVKKAREPKKRVRTWFP